MGDMSANDLEFLFNTFPALDKGIIQDVLRQQNNDVDKAVDDLLTLAVGDDIFAKSVFIEEKVSATQHLQKFDAQQEEILKQCQLRHAQEQRKRIEAERIESERKLREEEERVKLAVLQREAEFRKTEAELREMREREADMLCKQIALEKKQIAEMMMQQERLAQRELTEAEKIKREAAQARLELEKEKAAIAEEKRKIEEEKEKMEQEKRKAEEERNRAAPKLSIYTRKQQEKESNQESIANEIKALFISNGFQENEISMHDVSQDMELSSFLKEICNNADIKFPLVCAGKIPIGNIENVQSLVADKTKLAQLMEGEFIPDFLTEDQANSLKDGTGFVGRGVLDHCLDAAEYVISGVGSVLLLPVTILSYPFRSAKEQLTKGPNDVDFDIVHTNWYWRNLERRFRFTNDSILRLLPSPQDDIRAVHLYSTISLVKTVNAETFVINYKDGSSPDYVTAVPAASDAMKQLIKKRAAAVGAKPVFVDEADLP